MKDRIYDNLAVYASDEECEVIEYSRWVLPPIGLLPPIKEDVDKEIFSHRLLNRIYVGNIGVNVTEDNLLDIFIEFGPIVNVNLSIDYKNMRHKGFAFVEFNNPHSAQLAINYKDIKLDSNVIKVGRPVNYPNKLPKELSNIDKHIIFVSNINPQLQPDEVKRVFECFGEIKDVYIFYNDVKKVKRSVVYGFIKFKESSSSTLAVKGMENFELAGKKLRVGFTVTTVENLEHEYIEKPLPSKIYDITKKLDKKEEVKDYILLKNLIDFEELDTDFVDEMNIEMRKFGEIEVFKVITFKKPPIELENVYISKKEVKNKDAVFLYVKFKNKSALHTAMDVLDRRFFGGKRILVETCSEMDLQNILDG